MIQNDIDWLDEIVPAMDVVTETVGLGNGRTMQQVRTIVTWSRPRK